MIDFHNALAKGEYVMIFLAVLLVASLLIWWVRAAALSRQRKHTSRLMARIRDYVVEGDMENAFSACETSPIPAAKVINRGLACMGKPLHEIRSAMDHIIGAQEDNISRGCRWIWGIAVIAPLAGAAGTLAGICDALRITADAGTSADIAMIADEIAPAIVTSVAGLITGIVALVALIALEGACRKAKAHLHNLAVEFTELLDSPS